MAVVWGEDVPIGPVQGETVNGKKVHALARTVINALAWAPDGKYLALAGHSDKCLTVLEALPDSANWHCIHECRDFADAIMCVAWAPSGKHIVAGSRSSTAKVWETSTWAVSASFKVSYGAINSISWAPDSLRFISGSGDFAVNLWKFDGASTITELARYTDHKDRVTAVAWSMNGGYIASGASDKLVKAWKVKKDSLDCVATCSGHAGIVESVAWSSTGLLLASASRDKTVKVWVTSTWSCQATCAGHIHEVACVQWSPNGALLASASKDSTVKLWNPSDAAASDSNSYACVATCVGSPVLGTLEWASGGAFLATAHSGEVMIWSMASVFGGAAVGEAPNYAAVKSGSCCMLL